MGDKKDRHWALSRKFLGFLLTAAILTGAALIVKNNNYPALSLALVSTYSAFAVANTVAGAIGLKTDDSAAKKTEEAD